jgi:hypothetical protein
MTQLENDIIEKKVSEFVNNKKMFTSVNITNAIKMDGTWISNSEVAQWLRNSYNNSKHMTNILINYSSTTIQVENGQRAATLYYPFGHDSNTFTDTEISAMTPDEFKRIHGVDPFIPVPANVPVKSKITLIDKVCSENSNRIRIPAKIVSAIGLKPYKKVTDQKFAIKNIPATLKVHADGRVSIPRSCIDIKKGPVKIFLKDGVIGFEKA